jgi:hypothetical protein
MARCVLYAVGRNTTPGFMWMWRTADGGERSQRAFLYFHDCMEDAQAQGHQVDLVATIAGLRQDGDTSGCRASGDRP